MDMIFETFFASIWASTFSFYFKSPSLGAQELKITKKITRKYRLNDFILEESMCY